GGRPPRASPPAKPASAACAPSLVVAGAPRVPRPSTCVRGSRAHARAGVSAADTFVSAQRTILRKFEVYSTGDYRVRLRDCQTRTSLSAQELESGAGNVARAQPIFVQQFVVGTGLAVAVHQAVT